MTSVQLLMILRNALCISSCPEFNICKAEHGRKFMRMMRSRVGQPLPLPLTNTASLLPCAPPVCLHASVAHCLVLRLQALQSRGLSFLVVFMHCLKQWGPGPSMESSLALAAQINSNHNNYNHYCHPHI